MIRWTAVPLACLLLAQGCSLDRSGLRGDLDAGDGDAGSAMDAGAVDAGESDVDAGPMRDAGSEDGGGPDASDVLDAGPPDAGPPDAGPPSCASLYGGTPGYVECAERATECEFYADLNGTYPTCAAVCSAFGGRCLETYGESGGALCTRGTVARDCSVTHNDEICICTR